jgi:GNAT superfamily N-acetyltransferase
MSAAPPPADSAPASQASATAGASEEAWVEELHDGTRVRIRPLHALDLELERRFIEALSPQSRRFRFLESMQTPSDALLRQLTVINPSTDVAYLAVLAAEAPEREIGVARFSAQADGEDCEFAVTVSDAWQNKGLGTLLMKHLIEAARARGIETMHSNDAKDNHLMRGFAEHLHFQHGPDPDEATQVRYSVSLNPAT